MYIYHNNYEVQPAPSISEIFLPSIRRHFDHHFTDEDNCEQFVHNEQCFLQPYSVRQFYVDIFNRLQIKFRGWKQVVGEPSMSENEITSTSGASIQWL